MNILSITPLSFHSNQPNKQTNISKNNFTIPKLNYLAKDTVSFSGGEKVLSQRTKDISYRVANDIFNELEPICKDFTNILKKNLKSLVESDSHPDNPIMAGHGLKGRVKKSLSIIEKALSRNLRTKDEIKQMGDALGFRITLRSASQKDFDKLFTALGKMVKQGLFEVTEMENYRLTRQESYVSSKTLDKFENICQAKGQFPTRTGKAIPNGYTAFHISIKLPNGQNAEIQIMGRDLECVKELEDFYYKLRCHKEFDKKYKSIQEMMENKMANLDNFQQATLDRYIKDSYRHALEIPPRSSKQKTTSKDFLPIPYSLPQELGFANLQKMKDKCDSVAKAASTKKNKSTISHREK